jgi:hypothetical protein
MHTFSQRPLLSYFAQEVQERLFVEWSDGGVYDRSSGVLGLSVNKDLVKNPMDIRTLEERHQYLIYAHELAHLVQSCTTIYGISQYISEAILKLNTLSAVSRLAKQRRPIHIPLSQATPHDGLSDEESDLAKQYEYHHMLKVIMEGALSERSFMRGKSKDRHLAHNVYELSVGYAVGYHKGFLHARKLVYPLSDSRVKCLYLGGSSIKEAWAAIESEIQDNMLWRLQFKGDPDYKYDEVFDRLGLASNEDPRFLVYTCLPVFVCRYLDEPSWYRCFNSLLRLFDFVLMHTSFFDGEKLVSFDQLKPPDILLKDVLDVFKKEKLALTDRLEQQNLTENFLSEELAIVEDRLGLPKQRELIERFLNDSLDPIINKISRVYPSASMDLKFLIKARKALEMRMTYPSVFCNRLHPQYKVMYHDFLEECFRDGGFLSVFKDDTGLGDKDGISRWFSAQLSRQFFERDDLMCPLVLNDKRCPVRERIQEICHEDNCHETLTKLVPVLKERGHECLLTEHIEHHALQEIAQLKIQGVRTREWNK